MDWIPELRQRSKSPDHSWQQMNVVCWVLNRGILDLDQVFLTCKITEDFDPSTSEVNVIVVENNKRHDVQVERYLLFKRRKEEGEFDFDNIAKLPVNSQGEVFGYLKERVETNKPYFSCGTDLFCIKSSPNKAESYFNPSVHSTKEMQAAVDWLVDENTFKTEFSNPFTFTTEVLKRFLWTHEQQSIVFCGETQSGKTTNLFKVLEMICYYNVSGFSKDQIESVKIRNQNSKTRLSILETKIITEEVEGVKKMSQLMTDVVDKFKDAVKVTTKVAALQMKLKESLKKKNEGGSILSINNVVSTSKLGSLTNKLERDNTHKTLKTPDEIVEVQSRMSSVTGRKSTAFGRPSLGQSQSRDNLKGKFDLVKRNQRKAFNDCLMRSNRIANSLIQFYSGKETVSNSGVLKVGLSLDDDYRFLSASFEAFLLQSFKAVKRSNFQENGNFVFLYSMILGSSDEELKTLNLTRNIKEYVILNGVELSEDDKRNFIKIWTDLNEEVNKTELNFIGLIVACILKFGNISAVTIQKAKPLMNEIHKLLGFKSSELYSFLMMDKSGFLLKNDDFVERVDTIIEILYSSLVGHVFKLLGRHRIESDENQPVLKKALNLIDITGFEDVENRSDGKEVMNDFKELSANYFYEVFVDFFNRNRFETTETHKREELTIDNKLTAYRSNKLSLECLQTIEHQLSKNTDYQTFKDGLKDHLIIFDRQGLSKLTRMSLNPKAKEEDVVAIEHSFSKLFNYSLQGIFEHNKLNHQNGVIELLRESEVLSNFQIVQPAKKKSRLLKQKTDQTELFEGLNETYISFVFNLKINSSEERFPENKSLFQQLNNVDFESLIEHHKTDFPYKIAYRFFVEKFNIQAKIAQIKPDLNVDFVSLVRTILDSAFGTQHNDLFVFGKNNLFVREEFYEQLNSMLKENLSKSRLLGFVEKALKDILATHVDNGSVVIKLAQHFLMTNCTTNKYQRMRRNVNRLIKIWRVWKKRREGRDCSLYAINWVLEIMPYYNIKKITRLQAIWRGRQVRYKLYREESRQINKLQLKNQINSKLKNISTLIAIMIDNQSIQQSISRQQLAAKTISTICAVQHKKVRVNKAQRALGAFLQNWRIRKGLQSIKINIFKKHKAARKIQQFFKQIVGKMKKYYVDVENDQKKELRAHAQRVTDFEKAVNTELKNQSLPQLPLPAPLPAKDEVGKVKGNFSLQIFSVSVLDKPIKNATTFGKSFAKNLETIMKEDLLKLELTPEDIMMQTQKQKVIMQKINSNKCIEFKIPMKAEKITYVQDSFLYLEETGIMKSKYLSFDSPDINHFQVDEDDMDNANDGPESVFEFTKVATFTAKGGAVAGCTLCRKIFIQSQAFDQNTPPRVFQMKRLITQISMGLEFALFLDDSGVVYSIGDNEFGQLGLGHRSQTFKIQMVKALVESKEIVKSISTGDSHCLALTGSGKVFGWGNNAWYQISTKFRNWKLCFVRPKDITPELKVEINVKLQVYCGKQSSYVFTSNMKWLSFGRVKSSKMNSNYEWTKIYANLPKGIHIVGLDVKWNDYLEIVLLKIVDYRFSSFDKIPFMTTQNAVLFDHFTKYGGNTLLPFTDVFAKFLPLNSLGSKIVDVKNKTENQKYEKMMDHMITLK